jgi:NitT/TauT family transport system ATP-binding protein
MTLQSGDDSEIPPVTTTLGKGSEPVHGGGEQSPPSAPRLGGASHAGHGVCMRGVEKTYRTAHGTFQALSDATLEVPTGSFVSLVGPSGCGKSTALKVAAGLEPFDGGVVEVNGQPPKAGRRDVAILLQKPVLLPWRTVLKNVLLPAEIIGVDGPDATKRALELLDLVGLSGCADKRVWELSGGMQQRASLAQVFVSDPQVLFMDEPFTGVDEFTRERLGAELAAMHERAGRTTVYVTHNMIEAVFLSDSVAVMKSEPGRIVGVLPIDLPRPRTLDLLKEQRTQDLVREVRELLDHE